MGDDPGVIRILVVDDHAVLRKGVAAMIDPRPEFEMIGEAADGIEAVEKAKALKPDVILMDIEMPRKNGIEAIYEIKRDVPDSRILVLTSYSQEERVIQAIQAGADGYVLKVSHPDELLQSIRDVHHNEMVILSPKIASKILKQVAGVKEDEEPIDSLTEREIDVLKQIAKGLSNLEISEMLNIGEGTVRSHVNAILHKLNLSNRTQAALYALREGLTSLYSE